MRLSYFLLLLVFCGGLSAQSYRSRIHYKVNLGDTRQLHQLILLDYTKLLGVALEIKDDEIFFQLRSSSEVSVIPLSELRFLGLFTGSSKATALDWTETVGLADLTYERTALPYQTRSQLRVINLIYVVPEFNLNKHLQVGVGLAGPVGILATARLRYTIFPNVHLGLSNQTLFPPFGQGFSNNLLVLGDLHTMMTIGTEDKFFNLGTGIVYNTDDFQGAAWAHRLAVGGRLSATWHLYAEMLMVLGREDAFTSREVTLLPSINGALGKRRHRWQFGIMSVFLGNDGIIPVPIPYVGYQYYWGGNRLK